MKLAIPLQRKKITLGNAKGYKKIIEERLEKDGVVILSPTDALHVLSFLHSIEYSNAATILDPWYNKGVGGVRVDYQEFIDSVLAAAAPVSGHIYLWGFPEIVANFVNSLPSFELNAWLTWYYKNSPSVIRGWRSSQQACIHFCKPDAKLYPQHFLNEIQNERLKNGIMRFIPGPASVIEASLLVGFIGKKEKTPHPAQKPADVYEKLILMATPENGLIIDPMAGSGTAGDVAKRLGRRAILSDISEEYTQIMEKRLNLPRLVLSF